jgi:hypothetical protein
VFAAIEEATASAIANINDGVTIVRTTNNLVLVVISQLLQNIFYKK